MALLVFWKHRLEKQGLGRPKLSCCFVTGPTCLAALCSTQHPEPCLLFFGCFSLFVLTSTHVSSGFFFLSFIPLFFLSFTAFALGQFSPHPFKGTEHLQLLQTLEVGELLGICLSHKFSK